MAIKISISYTDPAEAAKVQELLQPIAHLFKVKKSTGTGPYKHLYFTPRNPRKAQ